MLQSRLKVVVLISLGTIGALSLDAPSVLLHLSDTHLSTNVALYWRAFGDREGDLELFAKKLLPLISPQATVISGDITDGKNAVGAGVQQEEEWQAYRRILDAFVSAGVAESSILDLRGNHDVFNMPIRGSGNDFFPRYAALGRRFPPGKRIFSHLLMPDGPSNLKASAIGVQSWESDSTMDGLAPNINGVNRQGASTEGQRRSLAAAIGTPNGVGEEEGECPAVALLGIDSTPAPGLRSPANFAGVSPSSLLKEAKAELDSILSSIPSGCSTPVIVAYGHYPLSTIDSPMHVAGPLGILAHISRSVHSMQGVAQLLSDYNVSSYLNGHLHGAFGQRLHRMHSTPTGGYLAELETTAWKDDRRFRIMAVDGGALSFADLFFHTPSSPLKSRKEDAMAMRETAWLEAYQQRGYAVTAADPSAEVLHHIALITFPPDARYSPLAPRQTAQAMHAQKATRSLREAHDADDSGRSNSNGGARATVEEVGVVGTEEESSEEGLVRALVFPIGAEAATAPEDWEVRLLSWLPGGEQFSAPIPMRLQPGTARLFQATLQDELSCGTSAIGGGKGVCSPPADHMYIQVEVRGPDGHRSASPAQPVGLRCYLRPVLDDDHASQLCHAVPAEAPLPLGTTWLEWFILAVNGPVLVHRIFIFLWACHLALLLLLPRMLCMKWAPRISSSPLFLPRSLVLLSTNPSTPPSAFTLEPSIWRTAGRAAGEYAVAAVRAIAGFVLWPGAALVLLAKERTIWTAMVVYCIYMVVGPWYVADLLTGYPKALLFHFGVLIRLPSAVMGTSEGSNDVDWSWRFIGTADTMFITLVHLIFCVLPLTLWVACVVGSRQLSRMQSVPSRSASTATLAGSTIDAGSGHAVSAASTFKSIYSVFTVSQWLVLLPIVGIYGLVTWDRVAKLNGGLALLLSPGLAWTIPLAVLLVLCHQLPDKRYSCMGKRE